MYKKLFKGFLSNAPCGPDERDLFIVEDEVLAEAIIAAGYRAVLVDKGRDNCFTLDELIQYMEETALAGTFQTSYRYNFYGSKENYVKLSSYLVKKGLVCYNAWRLFNHKEYLWLRQDGDFAEIRKIIDAFIKRCNKPQVIQPDLDRFHKFNDKGELAGVLDIEISEDIIEKVPFFVISNTPFVYHHGVYEEDKKGVWLYQEIKNRMYRQFIRSSTISRVYQLMVNEAAVQKQYYNMNNYPAHWINFRNGFYDPIKKVMIDHSPQYLSVNQIPYDYDPSLEPKGRVIEQFLSISLPDPTEQQMMWEYLGYSMTKDTQFQKFLILIGEGGTGKSVVIHLFEEVIGDQNFSSISLQDLNRRFYATGLFGKLLNTCGDIPCKSMETIDVLKKAVGEDTLLYEKKGVDATQFRSYAKLLFSANGIPDNLEDKSNTLYRRMMVLEMNQTIPDEKKDIHLKERINEEIDYAIHKAVGALESLYNNGSLTESENSKRCVEKARRASDSTQAFIDDRLRRQAGTDIERSQMYFLYQTYCEEEGRMPKGKAKFFNELVRKGYHPVKHHGIYKYRDVAAKEDEYEEDDASDEEACPF